jgi:Zn-dependent membrane protease YugP
MGFLMYVISVSGQLTDHYNPVEKTVNLSEAVYNQRNAAAAAVAAHECVMRYNMLWDMNG